MTEKEKKYTEGAHVPQRGSLKEQSMSIRRLYVICAVLGILLVVTIATVGVVLYLTMQTDATVKQTFANGNWGSWTYVSGCSHSCGNGTRYRSRLCNNPSPSLGGSPCAGNSTDLEVCNTDACPDYSVAFSVYFPMDGPALNTIKLKNVITNVGGYYNTTTGKFVGPYPGLYVFHLTVHKDKNADFARCCIAQNLYPKACASVKVNNISEPVQDMASTSVVLHINDPRQAVNLVSCTSASTMDGSFYGTTFSGYLLKAD